MALIEMYVSDSLYLNAEKISDKVYIVHLSNGKEIRVEKEPDWPVADLCRYAVSVLHRRDAGRSGRYGGAVLVPLGLWMLFTKKIVIY